MTMSKMLRVLLSLQNSWDYDSPHGHITCSSGGELMFDFTAQLMPSQHRYLIAKGFVQGGSPGNPDAYVYRPR